MKTPNPIKITALALTAAAAMTAAIWAGCGGVTDGDDGEGKRFAMLNGKNARTITVPPAEEKNGDTTWHTLSITVHPANGGKVTRAPDQPKYAAGTQATVCATPDSGHGFTGWTGAITSNNPCEIITMNGNKTLVANFQLKPPTERPALTTVIYPENGGSVTRTPDQPNYAARTNVVVCATPAEGYSFTGWTGAATSDKSCVTVTMDGDKALVASFKEQTYTLTIERSPATAAGTVTPASGSNHRANAPIPIKATPASGYEFVNWTVERGTATVTKADSAATTVSLGSDAVISANFQRTYTVTYHINGGTGTTPVAHTVSAGNSVTLPGGSEFSRSGFIFGGWNTNSSGTGTNYSAGLPFMPTENITLYARWTTTAITYTVTYHINGGTGTAPDAQTVNDGNSVTLPGNSGFSRANYIFAGWNTNSSGTGDNYSASASFTPAGDVTLYAKWNISGGGGEDGGPLTDARDGQKYRTVIIGGERWMAENLNYATSNSQCYGEGGQVYDNGTYRTLSSAEVQANCAKYGRLYRWAAAMSACPAGWRLPSRQDWNDLVQTAGGSSVAGGKLKSKTGWDIDENGRSYNGNGTDDFGFSALPGGLYDTYYGKFYGVGINGHWWSTEYGSFLYYDDHRYYEAECLNDISPCYGSGLSVRCVQGDQVTYTLTTTVAPTGTGTVSLSPPGGSYAARMWITATADPASGYEFVNWSGASTSTSSPVTIVMPASNTTLTANFQRTYTVTYDINGGTGTTPIAQTVNDGSIVTLASGSGFSRSGYTFGGWNTSSDGFGNNYNAGASFTPTSNTTLYARWDAVAVTYTITFNPNSGTVSPTSAVTGTNGRLTSLPTPTRSGYTFNGWFTAATGGTAVTVNTVFTANTTIYAQWTAVAVTYTVTYNANGGTGTTPPAQTVNEGSSVTLANGSGLTRSGFTFGGWNTNPSGSGTNYNAGASYTPTGNITLYARWNISGGGNCTYTGRTEKIGNFTWMAENLNCATSYSWCYNNADSNCTKYGRLYTWDAAMSVCPAGWRLPTRADWDDLVQAAGGNVAGTKLKSKTGWRSGGNGTDDFGFSALPGGFRYTDGSFYSAGDGGYWWSATENGSGYAWGRNMHYSYGDVHENYDNKEFGFSVRCCRAQDFSVER